MAMRRSHNLHTIYKAEVIEHPFPPEMGVEITCANIIIYEMSKLCMATTLPFYNISSSNFAVLLKKFWHAVSNCGDRFLFLYLYLNF